MFLLPILLVVSVLGLVLLTIISVTRFISGVMRVVQSVTTLQASMEAIKSQTREQDNHIKQLTGTDNNILVSDIINNWTFYEVLAKITVNKN